MLDFCLQRVTVYDIITKQKSIRPCGQAVKTEPSQGSISGSIPDRVTKKKTALQVLFSFCYPADRRTRRVRERQLVAEALPRLPKGNGRFQHSLCFINSSTRHSAKVILRLQLFSKYAIIDYTINSNLVF